METQVKARENSQEIIMTFKHKTLEERAAEYGGNLSLDEELEWDVPVGREVW